jgi:hypothetical protein
VVLSNHRYATRAHTQVECTKTLLQEVKELDGVLEAYEHFLFWWSLLPLSLHHLILEEAKDIPAHRQVFTQQDLNTALDLIGIVALREVLVHQREQRCQHLEAMAGALLADSGCLSLHDPGKFHPVVSELGQAHIHNEVLFDLVQDVVRQDCANAQIKLLR